MKWNIEVDVSFLNENERTWVEVEANNKEEAIKKAYELVIASLDIKVGSPLLIEEEV